MSCEVPPVLARLAEAEWSSRLDRDHDDLRTAVDRYLCMLRSGTDSWSGTSVAPVPRWDWRQKRHGLVGSGPHSTTPLRSRCRKHTGGLNVRGCQPFREGSPKRMPADATCFPACAVELWDAVAREYRRSDFVDN